MTATLVYTYIYCEKVNFTPDTIPLQMYASEKYMLDGLSAALWDWMNENINDDTACAILECSVRHNNSEMEMKVKDYIDVHATGILQSSGFSVLSQDTVKELLRRDDFFAKEEDIYKACLEWGHQRCKEAGEKANGPAIRRVLGNCLQLVRFPCMRGARFAELMESCPEVLTKDEQLSLAMFFLTGKAKEVYGFKSTPRLKSNPRLFKSFLVERFSKIRTDELRWKCYDGKPDAICFSCDKKVILQGITFPGSEESSTHNVEVEVRDESGNCLYRKEVGKFEFPEQTRGVEFPFDRDVTISPGKKYSVVQRLWGSDVFYGSNGRDTVEVEGVSFCFSHSPDSRNGTKVACGQVSALRCYLHS